MSTTPGMINTYDSVRAEQSYRLTRATTSFAAAQRDRAAVAATARRLWRLARHRHGLASRAEDTHRVTAHAHAATR